MPKFEMASAVKGTSKSRTRGREYFTEQGLDYIHNLKAGLEMFKYKKKQLMPPTKVIQDPICFS